MAVKTRSAITLAGVAALLLYGCSSGTESRKAETPAAKYEQAPDVYDVKLDTSKGDVMLQIHRAWAPRGADRFYNLVKGGFYDGTRFFRMLPNFIVQFGINGDPATNRTWESTQFPDDPVKHPNTRGTITFATSGPNTRTTQVFINLKDNGFLDGQGFAAFGEVTAGMDNVMRFYSGYGEGAPNGAGPDQNLIRAQGNAYLENKFPRLDYIRKATVVP